MKNIFILGSTGSIGTKACEVIEHLGGDYKIVGLSTYNNFSLLQKQIKKLKPKVAVVLDEERKLVRVSKIGRTKINFGFSNLKTIFKETKTNLVLNAIAGIAGLWPTIFAIEANADIALANKESLVVGGKFILAYAKKKKVKILPVDSEHSAIWQSLQGENIKNIKKIILTCSGGPFFGKKLKELKNVGLKQVLSHPVWQMGKKITVDSATLMNKGFEVIEASYLFDVAPEKIEVVIHPEGIVHSLVEFCDGSVKAQMAIPDMRLPIQYALTYPERKKGFIKTLNLAEVRKLTFYKPDYQTFPCLSLAYQALKMGGVAPAVLAMADEEAVKLFLVGKIKFLDIAKINKEILKIHRMFRTASLEDILKLEKVVRQKVYSLLANLL